ncbi:MAG: hypothetical protein JO250_19630 [Armatimonadetes bacterium]|nr:hypothetical protein [Armatimonadota bacterium]
MQWPLLPILLLFALTGLARPAVCQEPAGLRALLSGNAAVPLTIKLSDLNGDWRRVPVGLPADSGNMMAMYATLFSGGAGDVYYTKGDTVTVGVDQFLVAYHVPTPKIDFQALERSGGQPPKPVKLTPDTTLSLSLLNLHTVNSLSDIRPFDLQREIAESGAPSPLAGLMGARDDQNLGIQSLSNLKQLGLAVLQYTQDHDETLPPMQDAATVKKAIYPYVKSDAVFINPLSKQPYVPNTSLSHRKLASVSAPASLVLYYEATPAPDNTRAVLFMDGHVKRIPESQWLHLKAASHVPNTPTPSSLPSGGNS